MTDGAVLQVRLDARLKDAFAEAAWAHNCTPSQAMRDLIESFVRDDQRCEALRQSKRVAAASDAGETMDDMMRVQAWAFD